MNPRPIKVNITTHLRTQQDNKCCYCKYPLGFDIKQVDIEHIIPKSLYSKFTFTSLNLALSCPACNTKKSTKTVLNNPITRYPSNGSNIKIIHAHYDDYSEHIDIINNCVFVAKTSKGSETITTCELFRLNIAEQRAKAFQQPGPNYLEQLVKDINNADQETKSQFIEIIRDAIK